MKKSFIALSMGLLLAASFTSCMNEVNESPELDPDAALMTSPVSVGEPNTTIYQLKSQHADVFSATNDWKTITQDVILEGVVCANDVSGNLYQTVLLRDIDPVAGTDQCLVLAIRSTSLYPFFQLGQRVRVNLNGLCIGCYSKVPKIGMPYTTSSGNNRLGPIGQDFCRSNVYLVGKPNRTAPELMPVVPTDDWLRATANRTYMNTPMLATVTGAIAEVQGSAAEQAAHGEIEDADEPLPKTFGPKALRDAGFGVDRTIELQSNTSKVTLRTSTSNEIAYTAIPTDVRSYTGMLTFYSAWQLQLRSLDDIYPSLSLAASGNNR